MNNPEHIVELLRKHLNGTLTNQETIDLQRWVNAKSENQELIDRLAQDDLLISDLHLYWDLWNDTEAKEREQRIFDKVAQKTMTQQALSSKWLYKWIPYAAAIILISVTIFYFVLKPQKIASTTIASTATDVLPGGNKATLTLADGRTINLSSGQSGIIVGKDITYLDGSSIVGNNKTTPSETLVLKTPIGGNYKVILPDSSQVWLNANTTLIYPSRFSPIERIVQLEGEAYFQIQHLRSSGKNIPFKVMSNGQTVNVLGTEFNISAYAEEPEQKTTLVKGAVEIINHSSKSINRIIPGQQATLQGTETKINKVDVSKVVAWKYGQFSFDDKPFDQIMREMARWYNLTIQYEGNIPMDQFIGNAFKTDKLGTVLRFLESSNIQYRVKSEHNNTHRLIINNTSRKEAIYQ